MSRLGTTFLGTLRGALVAGVLTLGAGASVPAAAQPWFGAAPQPQPQPQVQARGDVASTAEIAELSLRIDRLEELVRRLNGEVEVLRHRLGEGGPVPLASAPPPPAAPAPAPVAATLPPAYAPTYPASPPTGPAGQLAAAPAPAAGPGSPTSLLPPRADYLPPGATGLGEPPRPLGTLPAMSLRGSDVSLGDLGPTGAEYGAAMASIADPAAEAENLYADAYGRLIAEDMAGAEAGFADFLSRYPGHELAGNAQYWLAETFYARGDYRQAAKGFLAGYQTYGASDKAPDSLLKLGMTLAALGQKSEACAALSEVGARFPGASAAVREAAGEERRNAGC